MGRFWLTSVVLGITLYSIAFYVHWSSSGRKQEQTLHYLNQERLKYQAMVNAPGCSSDARQNYKLKAQLLQNEIEILARLGSGSIVKEYLYWNGGNERQIHKRRLQRKNYD